MDEVGSTGDVEMLDSEGQMTNSTIREGIEGVWWARKSRASAATLGEGKSIQSSVSGLPNLFRHSEASYLSAEVDTLANELTF